MCKGDTTVSPPDLDHPCPITIFSPEKLNNNCTHLTSFEGRFLINMFTHNIWLKLDLLYTHVSGYKSDSTVLKHQNSKNCANIINLVK